MANFVLLYSGGDASVPASQAERDAILQGWTAWFGKLGSALVALKERQEGLGVLQEGLEADPGDLPEDQAGLLRDKIQTMIKDLEKNTNHG